MFSRKTSVTLLRDFTVHFMNGKWSVRWRWKNDQPPADNDAKACFNLGDQHYREKFDAEIRKWIDDKF